MFTESMGPPFWGNELGPTQHADGIRGSLFERYQKFELFGVKYMPHNKEIAKLKAFVPHCNPFLGTEEVNVAR